MPVHPVCRPFLNKVIQIISLAFILYTSVCFANCQESLACSTYCRELAVYAVVTVTMLLTKQKVPISQQGRTRQSVCASHNIWSLSGDIIQLVQSVKELSPDRSQFRYILSLTLNKILHLLVRKKPHPNNVRSLGLSPSPP